MWEIKAPDPINCFCDAQDEERVAVAMTTVCVFISWVPDHGVFFCILLVTGAMAVMDFTCEEKVLPPFYFPYPLPLRTPRPTSLPPHYKWL